MSLSLRDQLLKAGLVNQKQAKQVGKEKQKQQRLVHKGQIEADDSQARLAAEAQAEKVKTLHDSFVSLGETTGDVQAFMAGKVTVQGDMMKLMAMQTAMPTDEASRRGQIGCDAIDVHVAVAGDAGGQVVVGRGFRYGVVRLPQPS